MARADSHDLCVRVLDAVGAGLSRREAAARDRIGVATVIRWAALAAVTGETKAKRQGRPRGSKLDAHEGFLLALIEETDDITLLEMQDRLRAERGVLVGLGTLWRFFDGRAITWKDHLEKKTAHAAEQDRPDVAAAREAWFEAQPDLDPARLICVDETGLSPCMARLRGRCARGKRLRSGIPHGH